MVIIKALAFKDNEVSLQDMPCPVPEGSEVLIKVILAGICNTDLEITAGYLGFEGILGHEFVGQVMEDPQKELKGKRVVGSINIPCKECHICQKGSLNHCINMRALGIRGKNGAFARYLTLPRENVYPVPDEISDYSAVFVEPLAAAIEILEKEHIRPSERIAVLGDGKLGLLTAMVFWASDFDITLLGRHMEKLIIADDLGITTILNSGKNKNNKKYDVVVDCTGSTSGLKDAIDMVEPEGRIILKTTTAVSKGVNMSKIAVNEIKIIGSRCGPFPPALRLLQRNNLPLGRLIDRVYSLDEGVEAMSRAGEKGVAKVLLQIDKENN